LDLNSPADVRVSINTERYHSSDLTNAAGALVVNR